MGGAVDWVMVAVGVLVLLVGLVFPLTVIVHFANLGVRLRRTKKQLRGVRSEEVPIDQCYMVTYGTLGPPNDTGKPFGPMLQKLRNAYLPYLADFFIITPKDVPEYATRVHVACDGGYAFPPLMIHCRGARHGFWQWKPHAILSALERVSDGDVLIWRDADFNKYPHLLDPGDHVRASAARMLSLSNADISAPLAFFGPENRYCVDARACRDVPGMEEDLHVNTAYIVIRKSKSSQSFIREWAALCARTDRLLPDTRLGPCIIHLTDQACFNVVVSRWRRDGRLSPEWPNLFMFPLRSFHPSSIVQGMPMGTMKLMYTTVAALVTGSSTFQVSGTALERCPHAKIR